MRSAIVLALVLIVMAGTRYGMSLAAVATADGTAIGNIIVGMVILSPLVGLFILFRRFFGWQRRFHQRMSRDGAWRTGERT